MSIITIVIGNACDSLLIITVFTGDNGDLSLIGSLSDWPVHALYAACIPPGRLTG
jgi:hypothetical protein